MKKKACWGSSTSLLWLKSSFSAIISILFHCFERVCLRRRPCVLQAGLTGFTTIANRLCHRGGTHCRHVESSLFRIQTYCATQTKRHATSFCFCTNSRLAWLAGPDLLGFQRACVQSHIYPCPCVLLTKRRPCTCVLVRTYILYM